MLELKVSQNLFDQIYRDEYRQKNSQFWETSSFPVKTRDGMSFYPRTFKWLDVIIHYSRRNNRKLNDYFERDPVTGEEKLKTNKAHQDIKIALTDVTKAPGSLKNSEFRNCAFINFDARGASLDYATFPNSTIAGALRTDGSTCKSAAFPRKIKEATQRSKSGLVQTPLSFAPRVRVQRHQEQREIFDLDVDAEAKQPERSDSPPPRRILQSNVEQKLDQPADSSPLVQTGSPVSSNAAEPMEPMSPVEKESGVIQPAKSTLHIQHTSHEAEHDSQQQDQQDAVEQRIPFSQMEEIRQISEVQPAVPMDSAESGLAMPTASILSALSGPLLSAVPALPVISSPVDRAMRAASPFFESPPRRSLLAYAAKKAREERDKENADPANQSFMKWVGIEPEDVGLLKPAPKEKPKRIKRKFSEAHFFQGPTQKDSYRPLSSVLNANFRGQK